MGLTEKIVLRRHAHLAVANWRWESAPKRQPTSLCEASHGEVIALVLADEVNTVRSAHVAAIDVRDGLDVHRAQSVG